MHTSIIIIRIILIINYKAGIDTITANSLYVFALNLQLVGFLIFNYPLNWRVIDYSKPDTHARASVYASVRFPIRSGCTCCRIPDRSCDSGACARRD